MKDLNYTRLLFGFFLMVFSALIGFMLFMETAFGYEFPEARVIAWLAFWAFVVGFANFAFAACAFLSSKEDE